MTSDAPAGQCVCPGLYSLGLHLPPTVTRLFMGLALWEGQVLSMGQLNIPLVHPYEKSSGCSTAWCFLPSPRAPWPSAQGVQEVQL